MFTVYMKQPNTKPPEEEVYYIVAKNGLFLQKKNGWIDATIPVKQIAVLDEQVISGKILLPNLGSLVMAKTIEFFRAVYEKHKTEAVVLLHYGEQKGWELSIPAQEVTRTRAEYDPKERMDGYNCVGTIHSHGSMSAFHSGTDVHDEAEHDGIHITIGDIDNKNCFSVDVEAVVNGTRFNLSPTFIEGLKEVEADKKIFWHKERKYYAIDCASLNGWVVPKEWMSKVKGKIYANISNNYITNVFLDVSGCYGYGHNDDYPKRRQKAEKF